MEKEQMNKGVQILLERMESNPEEFIPHLNGHYPSKWKWILERIDSRYSSIHRAGKNDIEYIPELSFLSDAEVLAIYDTMQRIRGDLFTKQVMDTLLRGDEDQELSRFSQDPRPMGKKVKIQLNQNQIMMAQKMGVSPAEYAKLLHHRELSR